MEYAKDVVYNLKFDKMVIKNKKWTSRIKELIKNNKLVVTVTIFLTIFMLLDCFLLVSFANILKLL